MSRFMASLACALACVVLPGVASALGVESLQNSGPSSNRIDLVILGDGYTSAQQSQLTTDANALVSYLFALPPYQTYKTLFNVKLVHVISNQSGADNGSLGAVRDTALGSFYNCGGIDRLLCADGSIAMTVAAQNVPEYDDIVVLVNDAKYGGSGGPFVVVSNTPGAGGSGEILRHELGHRLGGLADEYDDPNPGFPPCDTGADCSEPNATLRSTRSTVKWNLWIDPSTPVPTPEGTGITSVGVFDGARYITDGVYRPVDSACLMHSLSQPFCAVCSEGLVREFWNKLQVIESATPFAHIGVTACDSASFAVSSPQLSSPSYLYGWSVDGTPRIGTGAAFTLAPTSVAPGTHTVSVVASDATPLVRNDPQQMLQESRQWTVDVTACSNLYPAESATLAGGSFLESVNPGFYGSAYVNFPATGGTLTFSNVNGNGGGAKTMTVRYALAGTHARTGNITVNGVSSAITFAPTGGWSVWQTLNRNVTLNNSAANVVQFATTGGDLGNIDQLMLSPSPAARVYPAENFAVAGSGSVYETVNTGFLGTAYVNLASSGGTLTFNNVDGNGGGTKMLAIRYALGGTASRTANMVVNGTTTPITLSPTAGWTTWAIRSVAVSLANTATNTIQFATTGNDFGNIDQITVP